MRIGNYDNWHHGPRPGWRPVVRGPRLAVEGTLTGVIAHSLAGHPGDNELLLEWDALPSGPALTIVRSYGDINVMCDNLALGESLAYRIPVAGFNAISAARLWLQSVAPVLGYLTVEVWEDTGGVPTTRLGIIGHIDTADIGIAWEAHEVYADAAYPCDPALAWLVLSGAGMTGAGQIQWGGTPGAGAGYAKYTIAGGWGALAGELSATAWQGGQFCILRGLCGAQGGGVVYQVDLGDGQLYSAIIADVTARQTVVPSTRGGAITVAPASFGVAEEVRLTLNIIDELGT